MSVCVCVCVCGRVGEAPAAFRCQNIIIGNDPIFEADKCVESDREFSGRRQQITIVI